MRKIKILSIAIFMLLNFLAFSQEKIITGIVSDNLGILPKVNVTIKRLKNDVLTDYNGKYSITTKVGDTLIFSFVEMYDVEKIVGLSNQINVSMKGNSKLYEVIGCIPIKKSKKGQEQSKTKIDKQITGIVSNNKGIVLPNAEVSVEGTNRSVLTNYKGVYYIYAKEGETLIFSFIDMISQKIIIDGCMKLDIKLSSNSTFTGKYVKKPIIYLYPEKETAIDVKFDFVGKVSTTFPKYDKNWSVIAYPDGKIYDTKTKRFYSSLFWDGVFNFPKEHYNYTDGFVVSKNNLTNFLIQKLEFMGLSTSETNEFIQFWLPLMEKNETNLIHFWINEDYDVFSKNTVNPKPDTSLRIFMEFSEVDGNFKIQPQHLFKTERKGFTLVEWGGSDVSTILKNEL